MNYIATYILGSPQSESRCFNVRLNPELHSKAYERALFEGKSLNQLVKEAIELKLHET